MAKPAAVWLPQASNALAGAAHALLPQYVQYLETVHKLLATYQHPATGVGRQGFMALIHTFMQELCGYPQSAYVLTAAAYSEAVVGSPPHVVPTSCGTQATLFYFTPADDADEVHDLWVKHAQVYLADPSRENAAAESATQVVFTNFFIIDGASKDLQTGAWNLWSVADIPGATMARVDLRHLETVDTQDPATSDIVHQRLQMLQYQAPPDVS